MISRWAIRMLPVFASAHLVRYIGLILHPLAIMECSLNEPVYMNLGYEGALAYSTQLIKQVASANGELVLLWHNDSITTRIKPNVSVDWQRKLFAAIIEELIKS